MAQCPFLVREKECTEGPGPGSGLGSVTRDEAKPTQKNRVREENVLQRIITRRRGDGY